MKDSGFVYIVGAGPGDPDLITVKGLRCVRRADVVLHDRLIDSRLLREVRSDAKIIDVGKTKGTEDEQQERIHRLMVAYGISGQIVCRLKGGDPFVFGRVTEEIEVLRRAGIEFEVIPGLSSATAVPAAAEIALTRRDCSHAFMVVAGSRSLGFESTEWSAAQTLLSGGGSVVVMMGLGRVQAITQWLGDNGSALDLPAAVIAGGTRSDQQTRFGTLRTIAAQTTDLDSPAILVLGRSVLPGPNPGFLELQGRSVSEIGVAI